MIENTFRTIVFILLLIFPASGAFTQERAVVIDSVSCSSSGLTVAFRTPGLMDSSIQDGLQRGFTVAITYRVELWKIRTGWFDRLEVQNYVRHKVSYKKFDRQYIWFNEETGDRFITSSLEKIVKRCTENPVFFIADSSKFEPQQQYYIVVEVTLEPFTVENMEEMRKWLRGEVESLDLKNNIESSPKRLTSRILTFIKNITGFGGRRFSGKTDIFTITAKNAIEYIRF